MHSLLRRAAPCGPQIMSMQDALTSVLEDYDGSTTPGAIEGRFGKARPYVSSKRKRKEMPPSTPRILTPVGSVLDGSAFVGKSGGKASCCTRRCHVKWTEEELLRCRRELPPYGPGSQNARMAFVRERIQDPPSGEHGNRLFAGPGNNRLEVCTAFFRKLYGFGGGTIHRASNPGGPWM